VSIPVNIRTTDRLGRGGFETPHWIVIDDVVDPGKGGHMRCCGRFGRFLTDESIRTIVVMPHVGGLLIHRQLYADWTRLSERRLEPVHSLNETR
jgi:hypothetical protein